MAADRTPYICQSQSVNLYLNADIDKWVDDASLEGLGNGNKVCIIVMFKNQFKEQVMLVLKQIIQKNWPEKKLENTKTDYEECLSCQ